MIKFIEVHAKNDKSAILLNVDSIDCVYYDEKESSTVIDGREFSFNIYESVDAVKRLLYKISE